MGARNGGGRRSKFAESTSTLALATVLASTAVQADDLVVASPTTTAVSTSSAANNSPGDITNESSITVTTPVAVTINSSNIVTNTGSIITEVASGGVGIRAALTAPDGVSPLNVTSAIISTGVIDVVGPASTNALFTSNVFNAGIRLDGPGTFTGNILSDVTGSITVGGNSSYGIQIASPLVGNLTNNGTISVTGADSLGIMTTAPITGSITDAGTISAVTQAGGTGIYIGAPVSGSLNIGGLTGSPTTPTGATITVGTAPTTDGSGNPVYQVPGTAAVWIAGNVNQGMLITGNGYTKNQENPIVPPGQDVRVNGTTYTAGQTYPNTAISTVGESTITATGGGPALMIKPGGPGGFQNVDIGALPSFTLNGPTGITGPSGPYSIINQGNIIASSSLPRNTAANAVNPYTNPYGIVTTSPGTTYVNVPGLPSTGVDVEGAVNNGTIYTTNLSGGFYNAGGDVVVTTANATATGFNIANHGGMSVLNNAGDIIVSAADTTFDGNIAAPGNLGGNAYAVFVDPTGTLNSFVNSGRLLVYSQGGGFGAFGIVDESGTLTNFNNSGYIAESISPYNTTGQIVAVDLSHNTAGVNFTNTGTIVGPVLLGSGTNNVTYSNGQQLGNLSFVGGLNTLAINNTTVNGNITLGNSAAGSTVAITNQSVVTGGVTTTGSADLTVSAAQLIIPDTQVVKVTDAAFNAGSKVTFDLNGTGAATGVVQASGNVSVANGATLTPEFTGIVQNTQTIDLISSSNLTLGAPLTSLFPSATSFVNAYTVQLDPNNPNNLQITARRRTTTEMGLGPNMSAAFNGAIGALALDQPVSGAIAEQATKSQFGSAFGQLMPDTTDAWRQAALSNQNMALGAINRRLQGIPNASDTGEGELASVWVQGLGTIANASPGASDTQPGYSYWGLGIAVGADKPIGKSTKIGANITETFTSVNLGLSPFSFLLIYSSQLNFYAREDLGRFYIQGIGGAGINDYSQRRDVTIGSFSRIATGKTSGYQGGGSVEAGVRLEGGSIAIVPYLRAGYLTLHEDGYSEKNGGPGLDLTNSSKDTSSLRTTAGFNLSKDFPLYYDSNLETDFRGSVTHDFKDDPTVFTSEFSATPNSPFTLTSVPHGPNIYSVGFGIGHKDSFSAITLDYDAEFTGHLVTHTAAVTLRFRL